MTRISDRHGRTLPLLATAAAAALLTAGICLPASAASTDAPTTQPAPIVPAGVNPAWSKVIAATQPSGRVQFALAATQPTEINVPAAATQPASTRPAQEIKLEFKDAPLSSVVDYLSEALGYTLVKDGPIEGRVSIVSRTPVSPDMALTLLNAALSNNQMAAIRDGRVLKIVSIDKVKKLNIPVNLGADPDEIPDTADWVTWVIPVKNVDAVKLRQDIQPLVSSSADFTANQGSNSLIMTDTSSNIKRIVKIVAKVDQSTTQSSVMRTYTLKFANAASTAKLLTTLFGTPDQGQNAQGGGGGGGRGGGRAAFQMMLGGLGGGAGGLGGAGGGGAGSDTGKNVGKVTASSDERTNTVVVIAPSDTQTAIADLINKLDSDNTQTAEIQTFTLKYADPTSAAKLINSIFQSDQQSSAATTGPRFGPFAPPRIQNVSEEDRTVKVTAAAADKTSTLVVSAPSSTMKIIEDILVRLDDDPNQQSAVTIFTLQHADADSAAKLINSIFSGTTSTGTTSTSTGNTGGGGGGRFGGGGGGGGGGRFGGGNNTPPEISGKAVNVNANSDERTNTVVVTAPPEATKIITNILAKLDSNPSADSSMFIYHLRNGVAADVQTTLNQLLGTSTTGGVSGSNTANRTTGTTSGSSGFGSSGGLAGGSSGRGGGGGGGGSGLGGSSSAFGSSTGTNNIQRTGFNTGTTGAGSNNNTQNRPSTELTGLVLVVADVDTNSLLVSTPTKFKEQVIQIIDELDRPVPQVLIKVLVAEVTHDRTNDFGADFSVLDTRASGKGLTTIQNLGNVADQATNGGLIVNLAETQVNAALHALATEGKLDVLSRPYILASDNQPASITVGQNVPFITNTEITDTGQQLNTITYQPVGIIVDVTPHVSPNGLVVLDVSPQITQLTGTTVPIGSGISAPVIANRSASSRVAILNNSTIVIGGMMQDQKTTTVTKIPLLGDIPILGQAFTHYQDDRSKTELLIFMTPHVALKPDALSPMSEEEMRHTKLTPNAVEPGVYKEHMAGMESGRTNNPSTTQPTTTEFKATPSTQPFEGVTITSPPPPAAPPKPPSRRSSSADPLK